MRSITISNGVVDSMKLRVGPVPPLLSHHPPSSLLCCFIGLLLSLSSILSSFAPAFSPLFSSGLFLSHLRASSAPPLMSKGIRWKDEEAQVDGDDDDDGDEECREGIFQIQFRLHDGSDIGPTTHSAETTIGNLKETILPQWPPGFTNAPQSVQDFKLIHGGQAMENDKTLGEYFNPPSSFLGITTIHVVMKPPSGFKLFQMRLVTTARKFGCAIL